MNVNMNISDEHQDSLPLPTITTGQIVLPSTTTTTTTFADLNILNNNNNNHNNQTTATIVSELSDASDISSTVSDSELDILTSSSESESEVDDDTIISTTTPTNNDTSNETLEGEAEEESRSAFRKARAYQLELYEEAQKANIVAYLDTGAGKTLVSILLLLDFVKPLVEIKDEDVLERLKEYIRRKKKEREESGDHTPMSIDRHQITINDLQLPSQPKKIVFLAPTVPLVSQQAKTIRATTGLEVGEYFGDESFSISAWDNIGWAMEFSRRHVFVLTPQLFLNSLRHGFFQLSRDVGLLIMDECHHAFGQHPYKLLMDEFYHPIDPDINKPKIFGMTASPIRHRTTSRDDHEKRLRSLEKTLNATVTTVKDRSNLIKQLTVTQETIIEHAPCPDMQILWEQIPDSLILDEDMNEFDGDFEKCRFVMMNYVLLIREVKKHLVTKAKELEDKLAGIQNISTITTDSTPEPFSATLATIQKKSLEEKIRDCNRSENLVYSHLVNLGVYFAAMKARQEWNRLQKFLGDSKRRNRGRKRSREEVEDEDEGEVETEEKSSSVGVDVDAKTDDEPPSKQLKLETEGGENISDGDVEISVSGPVDEIPSTVVTEPETVNEDTAMTDIETSEQPQPVIEEVQPQPTLTPTTELMTTISTKSQQLKCIPNTPLLSMDILSCLSPKLLSLIRILQTRLGKLSAEQESEPTTSTSTFRGLIFVEKRATALALCHFLNAVKTRYFPALNCGYMVGHGSGRGGGGGGGGHSMDIATQKQVIEEFSKGNWNLLVVTRVVEEGLDVPACNFVVIFDLFTTEIGYIQSRGRARSKQGSEYIVFVERGNQTSLTRLARAKVQEVATRHVVNTGGTGDKYLEDDDQGKVEERDWLPKELIEMDIFGEKELPIRTETGAVMRASTALGDLGNLLSQYSQSSSGTSSTSLFSTLVKADANMGEGTSTRRRQIIVKHGIIFEEVFSHNDSDPYSWHHYCILQKFGESNTLYWKDLEYRPSLDTKLDLDEMARSRPRYGYVYAVKLPFRCPLSLQVVVGNIRLTPLLAMQSAALETARIFYEKKLLNEHLLPIRRRKKNQLVKLMKAIESAPEFSTSQVVLTDGGKPVMAGLKDEGEVKVYRRAVPDVFCLDGWKDVLEVDEELVSLFRWKELVGVRAKESKRMEVVAESGGTGNTVQVESENNNTATEENEPTHYDFYVTILDMGPEFEVYALQGNPPVDVFNRLMTNTHNENQDENDPIATHITRFAIMTRKPIHSKDIPDFHLWLNGVFPCKIRLTPLLETDTTPLRLTKSQVETIRAFQPAFYQLLFREEFVDHCDIHLRMEPFDFIRDPRMYWVIPVTGIPKYAELYPQEHIELLNRVLNQRYTYYRFKFIPTESLIDPVPCTWSIDWELVEKITKPDNVPLHLVMGKMMQLIQMRYTSEGENFEIGGGLRERIITNDDDEADDEEDEVVGKSKGKEKEGTGADANGNGTEADAIDKKLKGPRRKKRFSKRDAMKESVYGTGKEEKKVYSISHLITEATEMASESDSMSVDGSVIVADNALAVSKLPYNAIVPDNALTGFERFWKYVCNPNAAFTNLRVFDFANLATTDTHIYTWIRRVLENLFFVTKHNGYKCHVDGVDLLMNSETLFEQNPSATSVASVIEKGKKKFADAAKAKEGAEVDGNGIESASEMTDDESVVKKVVEKKSSETKPDEAEPKPDEPAADEPKNITEVFLTRYNQQLEEPTLPLALAHAIANVKNMTQPTTVKYKRLRDAFSSKVDRKTRVPMEMCDTLPFPKLVFRLANALPSIVDNVDRYCTVAQLADDIGFAGVSMETLFAAATAPSVQASTSYERLETLGDSFLKYAASVYVFRKFPHRSEGFLNSGRVSIICNDNLCRKAVDHGLSALLGMCKFERRIWGPPLHYGGWPSRLQLEKEAREARMVLEEEAQKLIELTGEEVEEVNEKVEEEKTDEEPKANVDTTMEQEPSQVDKEAPEPDATSTENGEEKEKKDDEMSENDDSKCPEQQEARKTSRLLPNGWYREIPTKRLADFTEALIGAYTLDFGYNGGLHILKKLGVVDVYKVMDSGHDVITPAASNGTHQQKHQRKSSTSSINADDEEENFMMARMDTSFANTDSFPYAQVEETIGYKFKDKRILLEVFTHKTCHLPYSYERLEFLGDAVLDWIAMRHIYEEYPTLDPGKMSDYKQAMVNNESFTRFAVSLGLEKFIRHQIPGLEEEVLMYKETLVKEARRKEAAMSGSESEDGNEEDDTFVMAGSKILGDVFEALAGAISIDAGYFEGEEVLKAIYEPMLSQRVTELQESTGLEFDDDALSKNPVRLFRESIVKLGFAASDLVYDMKEIEDQANRAIIHCELTLCGRNITTKTSNSAKMAKLEASKTGLKYLESHFEELMELLNTKSNAMRN